MIDAPRYAGELRDLGVSPRELQRLRIQLSEVAGTRRGVLEVAHGTVSLALRPLAPAPLEITMSAEPITDERTQPTRTGPDYGWQQSTLAALPTQEGLLADAAGTILSAIMHPIVVVEAKAARVSTHPHSPRSVALDSVMDILASRGVEIRRAPDGFLLPELREREVWVIDPVYGARLVQTWLQYGTPRPARRLVVDHSVGVGAAPVGRGHNVAVSGVQVRAHAEVVAHRLTHWDVEGAAAAV